jgi:anaerobic selenocysteine-containing dehydrogenase
MAEGGDPRARSGAGWTGAAAAHIDPVEDGAEHPFAIAEPARVCGWVHERVLPGGRWRVAPAPLVAQLARLGAPAAHEPPAAVAIPRRVTRRMNSTLHDVGRGGEDTALWIHPDTAPGIADGELVEVRTATGALRGRARVTTDIAAGAVSVPHGLPDQNVACLTATDAASVDVLSGMVTQSGFAVSVTPVGRGATAGPPRRSGAPS